MAETLKTIKERRSCRNFKPDMVPKELLDKVLEAGTWAATGMGRQSPIIIAVTNKELRDKLSKMNADIMGSKADPFYGAPTVIVVMADSSVPTYIEDASLAIGNMLNAAYSLGLGSCWIHRAKEEMASPEGKRLMKEWGIDPSYVGVGNVILGYPAETLPEAKTPREDFALLDD